ncbi:MAG: homocysteine S-methyltransferase family protein [Halanaerobiales bacterium]
MSKEKFLERLENTIIIGDGAMGTMIYDICGDTSKSPEYYNLGKPDIILKIHREYIASGADLIETNTLGGSRLKLETVGLADKTREINLAAVRIAREAAGEGNFVAASVGPTGQLMRPSGDLTINRAREIFHEQIFYLVEGGADAIIIETMSDIVEMKAAILAARDFDIPVIAQMTYTENGSTLTGTPPEVATIIMESLGADIIGLNCVAGLKAAIPIINKISQVTDLPLSVFPNAGMPVCIKGKTSFPETPEEFVKLIKELYKYNVRIIGGCCGTTPEYINAVKREIKNQHFFRQEVIEKASHKKDSNIKSDALYLSGSREYLSLTPESPVYIIGEKLNPTGRKDIKEALKSENWSYLRKIAREQVKAGARLLDVNIGIPGIDKTRVIRQLIQELQLELSVPLVIDSDNVEILEAGLEEYIGKPLINSVNGEQASMDRVFPLVKKYGTAVIGLTLDEKGIPSTVEGRLDIARRIVEEAAKYGIDKKNIYIDTLTLTAGSDQEQVMITLETLKKVKEELGVKTTLGASNISHGLPERELINEVFLSMAIGYGLDMPIANPLDERIYHQIRAANLITNRDKDGEEFIRKYALSKEENSYKTVNKTDNNAGSSTAKKGNALSKGNIGEDLGGRQDDTVLLDIKEAIINGDRANIIELTQDALGTHEPQEIIDSTLIPAIQEVGELYDRGTYFLPQLLKSAETMQNAFDFLKEKMLTGESHQSKATVLLATVKGDIHDIGKNIAKTIFLNHGYEIIDLGANVDSELILETALEKNVEFVGLSSLMTTTLDEMRKVIDLLRENNYQGKTIIGGAVTSQEFADEIGADIYAADALDGVKKVNKVLVQL